MYHLPTTAGRMPTMVKISARRSTDSCTPAYLAHPYDIPTAQERIASGRCSHEHSVSIDDRRNTRLGQQHHVHCTMPPQPAATAALLQR
jgi:hypothetical protein